MKKFRTTLIEFIVCLLICAPLVHIANVTY